MRESFIESNASNNAKNFDLNINVSNRAINKSLISILIFLHIANAFAVWLQHYVGKFHLRNFYIKVFRVVGEGYIPTWYSACTLLFCALLLSVIFLLKRQKNDPYSWQMINVSNFVSPDLIIGMESL